VPCPADPEETAEEYCIGRLSDVEAEAFEVHCSGCLKCATILFDEVLVVGVMRAAKRVPKPSTVEG
jgi:hypothetical protein